MQLIINRIDEGQHNWPFVYAHGKAERLLNYDLVSGNVDVDTLPCGVIECEVKGHAATLFMWTYGVHNFVKGLVVLNDDKRSLTYARKCYKKKADKL